MTNSTQELIENLLGEVQEGEVLDVRVGAFWTAVVAETTAGRRCGLASTLRDRGHHGRSGPSVENAGHITSSSLRDLTRLSLSVRPMEVAIGMAAINAGLPEPAGPWREANADAVLAELGALRQVALVGHFPFTDVLRAQVGKLWVLELDPGPEDLPADAAVEILPQADVVALTAMTLSNGTFGDLMSYCRQDAQVLVLGPTTPLSPILYDYGVNWISGSLVRNIDAVLAGVGQGANFRQLHRLGIQFVTMSCNPTK